MVRQVNPAVRLARHLSLRRASVRRFFDDAALGRIADHIRTGELRHSAELRFVIEPSLSAAEIRASLPTRERALQVFSDLRIWDTEHNNGVMLYLLLADHAVEIVVDRAAAHAIGDDAWQQVCAELTGRYRAGDWLPGTLQALDRIHALLAQAFPPRSGDTNELPDRPVVL